VVHLNSPNQQNATVVVEKNNCATWVQAYCLP
jgi:hypothetical protein